MIHQITTSDRGARDVQVGSEESRGRARLARFLGPFAAGAVTLLAAAPSFAGTATLNGSSCSLAVAVGAINQHVSNASCGFVANSSADKIIVPNGAFVSTSRVELNRPVTIQGNGAGVSTLRGNIQNDFYFIRALRRKSGRRFCGDSRVMG